MKNSVFNLKGSIRYILTVCGIIIPYITYAQYSNLSGKITDAQTLKPLTNAEVYIANTTIRAKSDMNGNYAITHLPTGTYIFIARCDGYETKQVEFVAATDNQKINFTLAPRVFMMPEVTITAKSEWKQQFEKFKREFLGKADTANYKILNPQILDLKYNLQEGILSAKTDDFLEIVNKRLGYKLRFLINDFWVDYSGLKYHYSGSVIFEEMNGTEKDKNRWNKGRDNAYDGSFRHFLVALTSNQVKKNRFVIKRLIRVANPKRLPDSLITYKLNKEFKYLVNNKRNNDSLNKWLNFRRLPKIVEGLEKQNLTESEIIKPGELPQTYDLQFNGCIYVIYKGVALSIPVTYIPAVNELQRFSEAGFYQIAAVSMKTPQQPITFNDKGLQISKGRLFNEGAWSESRVLDLLPFDYAPSKN